MTTGPSLPAGVRTRLAVEVLIVLGVSLGRSAAYSLLQFADVATRGIALNKQTTTMNASITPDRPWLDLAYQLANLVFPLVPVALAWYLLRLHPPDGTEDLGIDRREPFRDALRGLALAAAVGFPGLGLYLAARAVGLNTNIAAANLAAAWWTVPVLVGAAAMNAILEEVVVVGYLVLRLRDLRWRASLIVAASALLRGTYHLYQGVGGFVGNLVMGVIFAALFLRWRRVLPLVGAHFLLDVAAFVGYSALHGSVPWL